MKILSVKQYNAKLKATVQQTGRLSFSEETTNALVLSEDKGVKFFMEGNPESLCIAITASQDEDSFPLKKSGATFYVTAQLLFNELGIDYKNYTVIYDLVRCKAYDEESGGESYKLNYRPIKKKKVNEEEFEA